MLQVRYSPYAKPLFNRLETASLVTTLLTAVVSTALLQYNVGVTSADLHPPDAMTGIEWAVTVLLGVMNVGTFVVLAGLWLYLQCARARGIVSRTAFVTALAGQVGGMRASLTRRRTGSSLVAAAGAHATPNTVDPVAGVLTSAGADGGGLASSTTVNPLLRARAAGGAAGTTTVAAIAHAAVPEEPSVAASRRVTTAAGADELVPSVGPPAARADEGGVAFDATRVSRSRQR